MKVSELIHILQRHDPDALVCVVDADTGWLLPIEQAGTPDLCKITPYKFGDEVCIRGDYHNAIKGRRQ